MTRPPLIRAGFFVWLAVPAIVWFAVQVFGLPYLLWSYEWTGRLGDDVSRRHYTRCTYLGPSGAITEYPHDGRCGWAHFSKARGGR